MNVFAEQNCKPAVALVNQGFVHDARPTGWIVPSSMRNKQHALLFPGEVAPDRDFWQESIFR